MITMTALLAGALLSMPISTSWQDAVREEIPLLGHRNWIVIADSAYPAQNSPGIRTVVTHASQETVLNFVLAELGRAKHVYPLVRLDKELHYVTEKDAPGITSYRNYLERTLKGKTVTTELHENIIKDLDEAGKTFRVLLLKSDFTIPYTSVFLQLDCAYWGPEKEAKLRAAMSH